MVCTFQIFVRMDLAGFFGARISSMRLIPSLPVNTARHVITFGTRQFSHLEIVMVRCVPSDVLTVFVLDDEWFLASNLGPERCYYHNKQTWPHTKLAGCRS